MTALFSAPKRRQRGGPPRPRLQPLAGVLAGVFVVAAAIGIAAMPAAGAQTVKVGAGTSATDDWTSPVWAISPTTGATYPKDTSTYGYVVNIGSPGVVTVDLGSISVTQLRIDAAARLDVAAAGAGFTVSDSAPIFLLDPKDALIVNGTLNVEAGAWMDVGFTNIFYADNTLLNNNRINLNATAVGSAGLYTEGGFTNAGGAEIVMTDVSSAGFAGNRLDGQVDSGYPSIGPWLINEGTIRGAGVIKDYTGIVTHDGVTNTGTILADGANPISFVSNGLVDNQGVMQATGAGGFDFQTGTFQNTGSGVIQLQNSQLMLGSATQLTGGSVDVSGGGGSQIIFNGNQTSAFDINNTGSASIDNYQAPDPNLTGDITNTGAFWMGRAFNLNGMVHNNTGGTFHIDDTNVGVLEFNNHADANISNGSTLTIAPDHDYLQDAGTTYLVSATLAVSGTGKVRISGGSLEGSGTVDGPIEVSGTGSVDPGFSPGDLTVNGVVDMSGGSLNMEIGGTARGEFDTILFRDVVNFTGGSIHIDFINGFLPGPGERWALFTFVQGFTGLFPDVTVGGGPFDAVMIGDGEFIFVPEPATLSLLTVASLALLRRKR